MIVVICTGVLVGIFLIWSVPKFQIKSLDSIDDPIKKYELENELRKTIVQITGGFSLILSLLFTWHQLAQTQDKDIAEQINKTIALMGNQYEYVRIGAIYSMEQLAVNHKESGQIIINILTSYIRSNYKWNESTLPEHRNEVTQAALTVVSKSLQKTPNKNIDLSKTDLRRLELQNRALSNCTLIETHFEEADLLGTNFNESDLTGSFFDGSNLHGASFIGANLSYASLRGALFVNRHAIMPP